MTMNARVLDIWVRSNGGEGASQQGGRGGMRYREEEKKEKN